MTVSIVQVGSRRKRRPPVGVALSMGVPPEVGTARAAVEPATLFDLYQRWHQYTAEYQIARWANCQELMENVRGLMIAVRKEIERRGGVPPTLPI